MSSQAFDGIRVLSIGPITIPVEVVPGDRTIVTVEGGKVRIAKSGETLSVSQGGSFTASSTAGRTGGAYANASVSASGFTSSASATIGDDTASVTSDSDPDLTDQKDDLLPPSKITIHLPEGTAIQARNYVNGMFRVGPIKGPLAIGQMVNAHIAVDEVTDVKIKMLVNCHGFIHATGKVKRGMMVNCDVRID
jgi:hypothetical protein